MRLNLKNNQRGFTLVEVTIILLVLVILSTIMLPQLGNFNRLARFVKAREDVGALCSVMKKMLDEVMLGAFYEQPGAGTGIVDPIAPRDPVGMLFGPGAIPIAGSEGDGDPLGSDDCHWRNDPGSDASCDATPDNGSTITFDLGEAALLENHLQRNDPDGAAGNNRYKNPVENPQRWAAGAFFGWRGPYMDELTTDPWGYRYAVNTFGLYAAPGDSGNDEIFSTAVVCYSAGPDGGIDTEVNQPHPDGWQFGRDDVGAILSAGGPF